MERPWAKHYTDTVPGTLVYPHIPIDQMLTNSAKAFPENSALIFGGMRITYRELDRLVDQLCPGTVHARHQKG